MFFLMIISPIYFSSMPTLKSGGILCGPAIQSHSTSVRASRVSLLPEGQSGNSAAWALSQDRWGNCWPPQPHRPPPSATLHPPPPTLVWYFQIDSYKCQLCLLLFSGCPFNLQGVGVVSWSPLACGIITGKYENGVPESSRASMKVKLSLILSFSPIWN